MGKGKLRNIIFSDELYKKSTKYAREMSMSFSDFVREAIKFYLTLDPYMLKRAGEFSVVYDVDTVIVVNNFCLSRIAEMKADSEVFGFHWEPLFELAAESGKIEKGEKFYNRMEAIHRQKLEKVKREGGIPRLSKPDGDQ